MGNRLSKAQLAEFEQEGGLYLESVLDPGEVKPLLGQAHAVFALDREKVVRAHSSPVNMSPYDRTIVHPPLCRTDNHIRQFKRPAWIAERDFAPIKCLPESCPQKLVEAQP